MKEWRKFWIPACTGAAAALVVLIIFSFVKQSEPTKEENEEYARQINQHYRVFSLPLPDRIEFAGENVPLDQFDLRERLDRELLVNTYWQSNSLLSIKRSHRWFPVIEPILKAKGIPDDFKYLALIESGYTNVVSPSGATGFWQFLEATGKEYGLEINDEVDERYSIEKSTLAACNYLLAAYQRFGSWSMAAASYNMGIPGLEKQSVRQQIRSYWDLLLNDETNRYLFRILAIKEIVNNADKYGFFLRAADLYEPIEYRVVTVDSTISDLTSFSKKFGISYKTLKLYNPWLRQGYLKNKERRTYEIKLPVEN